MSAEPEREAFETWAGGERLALNRHCHSYAATSTAWCWDAWQAATKHSRATLDAAVAAARAEERRQFPNLLPVIQWLEGGCDPAEAAKELRIYQRTMRPEVPEAAAIRDLKPEGE